MSEGEPATEEGWLWRVQSVLLQTPDVGQTLDELTQISTTVVRAAVSCSITLNLGTRALSVGSSDARADLLDETQYQVGVGPCLHSMRTGEVVNVPDVAVETRWPEYLGRAAAAGLRCCLTLPLSVGADTFGALNVYGFDETDLFGAEQRRQLELFAAQAAGTLRITSRRSEDQQLMRQLEEALHSRADIDQALGILMATLHCTAAEAFDVLRTRSQQSQRRIREIAVDLIARTSGRPPEPGRRFQA